MILSICSFTVKEQMMYSNVSSKCTMKRRLDGTLGKRPSRGSPVCMRGYLIMGSFLGRRLFNDVQCCYFRFLINPANQFAMHPLGTRSRPVLAIKSLNDLSKPHKQICDCIMLLVSRVLVLTVRSWPAASTPLCTPTTVATLLSVSF